MIRLYNSAGVLQYIIPEYETLMTTRRYSDVSEFAGRFAAADYAKFAACRYVTVDGEAECYLIENLRLITDGTLEATEASGRSAEAELEIRTVNGTQSATATKPGAYIQQLIATLTGSRALNVAFGDGATLGTAIDRIQRSWGDMLSIAYEVATAQDLGITTRLVNGVVTIDVVTAVTAAVRIGEKYGNASGSVLELDTSGWRNYAYVLGEGEGTARKRVEVDQSAGGERRELYVDASDLQQGALTTAAYNVALTQRGREKLAETRRIYFADADITEPLTPGDLIEYDSTAYSVTAMVEEVEATRESRTTTYAAKIGQGRPTVAQSSRRTAEEASGRKVADTLAEGGWLTTGITAATGWAIVTQQYRRVGQQVSVSVRMTRDGAEITVPANGDIGNVVVATMPSGYAPSHPAMRQGLASGENGRMASWTVATTGDITLCAVSGGANIADGNTLSCSGIYLLG